MEAGYLSVQSAPFGCATDEPLAASAAGVSAPILIKQSPGALGQVSWEGWMFYTLSVGKNTR